MKTLLKKIALYLIVVIILGIVVLLSYVKFALPNVGSAPSMKVEITPDKIERGKYLAYNVALCMDCHSTRQWEYYSGPMKDGSDGKGGEIFDQSLGFPGKYIAPNITPYHLKDWTDGEIFRAITSGVSKDGRALFSVMPYHLYGQIDQADIESIIAFIRSLPPIESAYDAPVSDFPMNFIINTFPSKPTFQKIPLPSDVHNYGKYMITAAGCMECHTKQENGKIVGERYAGGFEFKLPDGSVIRSSNITPDKETGIGTWDLERFVSRFKMYDDSTLRVMTVDVGSPQTLMPWTMYAGMKVEDLTAIFTYLQSLKPIKNEVIKFTPKK